MNDRNAGRKKVKDGVKVTVTVTKSKVKEFKQQAKNYQEYEKTTTITN